MKLIALTRGKFAQVDDEDYEWLNQWKWYAQKAENTYYARRAICISKGKCKNIKMHRLIMNTSRDELVDHRDHNGLNCQRSNLRNCTDTQNNRNRKVTKSKFTSDYLGVSVLVNSYISKTGIVRKYYIASMSINKKSKHLGTFPFTPEGEIEAAKCYDNAAKELYSEFVNLNFE